MPDSQLKAKIAKADEDGKVVIYRHCSDGREPTMPESSQKADQLEHSPDYAGRPTMPSDNSNNSTLTNQQATINSL